MRSVLLLIFAVASASSAERDVSRREVREDGLVATLFLPSRTEATGCLMVLGGSEGGIHSSEWLARRFAEHGWPALAVAYFGIDDLTPTLANIPLEYFDRAVTWMAAQPFARKGSLALVGSSRGAEIALLVAAHNDRIDRVIAYAPSSVVWGPVMRDAPPSVSAWSREGRPLPFVRFRSTSDPAIAVYRGTPDFMAALNRSDVEEATIPVENIRGAVLLLSGEDDQLWPSTYMAEAIVSRLRLHRHGYRFKHISFPKAGHVMLPGMDPAVTEFKHPLGITLALGGTRDANDDAQRKGWAIVLEFLKRDVRPE